MSAGISLANAQPPPSLPVVDTISLVKDPADGTKRMRIDVGAVATATVRVLSMGDRDVNLASGGTFAELSHTHAASQITAGTFAAGTFSFAGSTISDLGAVTTADINGGTIDGVSIGSSSAATIANVDNLRLDGNTLSSQNTNGDITLDPNGTGKVQIASGAQLLVNDTTASTSPTTGAAVITGGLGVGGQVTAAGKLRSTLSGAGPGSGLLVEASVASLALIDSDASADNKTWDFFADFEKFTFRAVNDANSAASSWCEVDRTGITIDQVKLLGTSLWFDGAVRFGTHSAIGAETVTGYITITDSGGTSRKLAVVS